MVRLSMTARPVLSAAETSIDRPVSRLHGASVLAGREMWVGATAQTGLRPGGLLDSVSVSLRLAAVQPVLPGGLVVPAGHGVQLALPVPEYIEAQPMHVDLRPAH